MLYPRVDIVFYKRINPIDQPSYKIGSGYYFVVPEACMEVVDPAVQVVPALS